MERGHGMAYIPKTDYDAAQIFALASSTAASQEAKHWMRP